MSAVEFKVVCTNGFVEDARVKYFGKVSVWSHTDGNKETFFTNVCICCAKSLDNKLIPDGEPKFTFFVGATYEGGGQRTTSNCMMCGKVSHVMTASNWCGAPPRHCFSHQCEEKERRGNIVASMSRIGTNHSDLLERAKEVSSKPLGVYHSSSICDKCKPRHQDVSYSIAIDDLRSNL